MHNTFFGEAIISGALIILLAFFLNPLELMMPDSMHAIMVPLLLVLFVVFASILWKETPGDERAHLHKFIASRFAYFASVTGLIIAIIFQSVKNAIDPWLVIVLCFILPAKIAGLIYGYIRH